MLLSNSNEKLRHEITTLRIRLSAYQVKNAAQAEVIKAQRVNLDAARIIIRRTRSAAEDAQGEWLSVAKPYLPMEIFKFRQISEILSTALEGIEPEEE